MCWRFWIHSVTGWSLSHKDCSCIVHVPAVNLPTVNVSCWGLNGTHRHWSPELIYAPFPLDRSEFWIGKRYYQGGQHWCCDNIVLVFVWNLPPFFSIATSPKNARLPSVNFFPFSSFGSYKQGIGILTDDHPSLVARMNCLHYPL